MTAANGAQSTPRISRPFRRSVSKSIVLHKSLWPFDAAVFSRPARPHMKPHLIYYSPECHVAPALRHMEYGNEFFGGLGVWAI